MARNRKNDSAALLGPALAAIALCAIFITLGVGYAWLKNEVDVVGRQIKDRETRLGELQRQNKMRREQLAGQCSPVALDARVKYLKLPLKPPALSQVIRLVESPETAQTPPPSDMRQAEVRPQARKN